MNPVTLVEFREELESWIGTPFAEGARSKQGGADCINFVFAILDYIYRFDRPTPLPKLPAQCGYNNPSLALKGLKRALDCYKPDTIWDHLLPISTLPDFVQPADVIIIKKSEDQPAHVLIAGPRINTMWHCDMVPGMDDNGGVMQTSYGWCRQVGILKIWRPQINWSEECELETGLAPR